MTQTDQTPQLSFCELLLRDGIQGWPTVLSTDDKLRLAHAIDRAGVAEIDLTSFVPARTVPQFADAECLLEAFEGQADIRVLAVNQKGVDRLIEAHRQTGAIDTCGMPISASESHNKANLRCDHPTHKDRLRRMVDDLADAGVTPMVCVATAWGCPIEGRVEPDDVIALAVWLDGIGVKRIMLGDTTGMANPQTSFSLFDRLKAECPGTGLIAHFHDNRGFGLANVLAAIQAGVTSIDACLGGLGGEPASVEQGHVGMSGNVVSEDLISMLEEMGYQTRVDLPALLHAGQLAETIIQQPLFSKAQRLRSV